MFSAIFFPNFHIGLESKILTLRNFASFFVLFSTLKSVDNLTRFHFPNFFEDLQRHEFVKIRVILTSEDLGNVCLEGLEYDFRRFRAFAEIFLNSVKEQY